MRTVSRVLVIGVLVVGCASEPAPRQWIDIVGVTDSWDDVFEDAGVDGTFVLHEVGSPSMTISDDARARAMELPASTFKILNSLIILQSGVVDDVDEVIPWDGVDRGLPAWNRDHSLRSGIEVSAVWMYQELARRVGPEEMARLVGAADYGNGDIGGAPIDEFWLRGDLRISAIQQADFLARLLEGRLPFDDGNVAAVREIVVRESGDGWLWAHKTGTSLSSDPVLGWLVGWTEHAGRRWTFAMAVDLPSVTGLDTIDPEIRERISRTILEREGALPSS